MDFQYDTIVQLVKGEGSSKGKMLMKGIASTPSKDTDGHSLNPVGFDTSYFLQKGFINWNHEWKKSPLSIIGRPTKASVNKKNELEIEYSLFKGHKMAEEVYELAKALGENGIYLGLSIEGSVTETDPNDKNKITKARITDCAITPHPKNAGTVTQLIKGNNLTELVDFDGLGTFEVSPDGALLVKGTTTQTADAITPESVEGMDKDKKKKKDEDKEKDPKKMISKADVFKKLELMKPDIKVSEAEAIFNYTINFQKSLQMSEIQNEVPQVSEEDFNGALAKLGLMKGEDAAPVVTDPAATEDPAADPDGDAPADPSTEDPSTEDPETPEAEIEKSQKVTKAIKDMTDEEKKAHKEGLEKSLKEIEELEKGAEAAPLQTPEAGSPELIKAVTSAIIKSQAATEAMIQEKTQALGTLHKGTLELVKGLESRLAKFETEPQAPRAVLTKGHVPKPGEALEKGGQPEGEVYSVSQQKGALCTRLTDAAIEKAQGVENLDARLKADLVGLEAGSHLAPSIVEFAKSLNITIIE